MTNTSPIHTYTRHKNNKTLSVSPALLVLSLWGIAGWILCASMFFCSKLNSSGDHNSSVDLPFSQAQADEWEPNRRQDVLPGQLTVVDSNNSIVGIVVSKRYDWFNDPVLQDGVLLFDPKRKIFYYVEMNTGKILLPQKILFSEGNCLGDVAVRTTCTYCRSGYGLAFSYNGKWYELQGGEKRVSFHYSSYVAPQNPEGTCTGHLASTTQGYRAYPLPAGRVPPKFVPPYRFEWVY